MLKRALRTSFSRQIISVVMGREREVSDCRQYLTLSCVSLTFKVTDLRAHDKEKHWNIQVIPNSNGPFFLWPLPDLAIGHAWTR